MIYAQEMTAMSLAGLDYLNGSLIANRISITDYKGMTGSIRIGDDGERDREFELKTFVREKGKFEVELL